MLFSYIHNNRVRLEDERKRLQSNIVFREADSLDCIRLIKANEHLKAFKKMTKEILLLLKLDKVRRKEGSNMLIGECYVCCCCEYCKHFEKCKKVNLNLVICQKDFGDDDNDFCYRSCRKCMDDYRIECEETLLLSEESVSDDELELISDGDLPF